MDRDAAWQIVTEHVQDRGLRRHMLAVEAAMRWYARKLGQDEDPWGLTGLLHDYDWEIHPSLEQHPRDGAPLLRERGCEEPVVRAILALRANCLARGHSGLRVETLQRMIDLLNAGIHPVVPEQGSVGASGDLAPLAHIALALIGEGDVFHRGRRMRAAAALKRNGLEPIRLVAKEGLALVNGTQVMGAIGTLALLAADTPTAD